VAAVAPTAVEVVELQFAGGKVGHDGVNPVRELHGQPFHLAAEELRLTIDRSRQAQAIAGGTDSGGVLDLRL